MVPAYRVAGAASLKSGLALATSSTMKTLARILVLTLLVAAAALGIAWLVAREEVERLARDLLAPPGPLIDTSRTFTLQERIAEIGPRARAALTKKFENASVAWPPAEVTLVAIKDENILELHARMPGSPWILVHTYPVLKASGTTGPKLRQGDKQVPEGVYRVTYLNPNSRFHVSLRLDYPNAFDSSMGAKDGRADLGGDIMIHGKAASIGCLAMGDAASEELFFLAHSVGLKNIKVIIAPTDFRAGKTVSPQAGQPAWVAGLYTEIARELGPFSGS